MADPVKSVGSFLKLQAATGAKSAGRFLSAGPWLTAKDDMPATTGPLAELPSHPSPGIGHAQSLAAKYKDTPTAASTVGVKSYVRGTNYVPRTGNYKLHKGEAVIPSKFNPIHQAINGDNLMAQPKLGSGARFAALKSKLGHKSGIRNPAALAAVIGRKKYGASKMAKMSAAGRKK